MFRFTQFILVLSSPFAALAEDVYFGHRPDNGRALLSHARQAPLGRHLGNITISRPSFFNSRLFLRQTEECEDPVDFPCPSGAGCCQPDTFCLESGCCPDGSVTCEQPNGCYEAGAVCCEDGVHACPAESTCLLPDGCCPDANPNCGGENNCYLPDAVCCPNDPEHRACEEGTTCCLAQSETGCCDSGTSCCPEANKCCIDETATCCPEAETCCPLDWSCCEGTCCPPDSKCGSQPGYCSVSITKTSSPSLSRSSTSSAESESTPKFSIKTPSLSSKSAHSTATPAQTTPTPSPSPSSSSCTLQPTDDPSIPTFTISYREKATQIPGGDGKEVCLDNRELMDSMCRGMSKYTKCGGISQVKLTVETADRTTKRNTMCPRGFCDSANQPCDANKPNQACNPYLQYTSGVFSPRNPFILNCDEFPFASSSQGGDPSKGTSTCIPGWQNSWQGHELMGLGKYSDGQDYIIQVTGWDCASGRPTAAPTACKNPIQARDPSSANLTAQQFSGADLFSGAAAGGLNLMLLYFGDVDPGAYNYSLQLSSGSFTDVAVIDYLGATYVQDPTLSPGEGQQVVSFSSTEPGVGIALVGATSDTQVALAYNVSGEPTGNASSAGNPNEGGIVKGSMGQVLLAAVLAGWIIVFA